MLNKDQMVKLLEREFREKRVYGDAEDLKLFDQVRSDTDVNCKILVNEYYSHGGFNYPDNKAAEDDPSNYIEVSVESVQEAIKNFTRIKIKGADWSERPLYRIDLEKPPILANVIPLGFSQYFNAIAPRKAEIYLKNPYYNIGQDLRSLALKRNDLVLDMRENPSLTSPESEVMKEFKNIYSQMVNLENTLIRKHIETHIGEIAHTTYIDDDEFLPFYIYQIPKVANKDFGVLITSGFSMLPLSVPEELQFIYNYLELLITIPYDFPLPLINDKNYKYYWLIDKLIFFISYIHREHTFFLDGHTYGNGNPPKPFIDRSELCGFLFKFPFDDLPASFCELIIPSIKNTHFLQLVPLYENELYYALEQGGDKLIDKFDEKKISLFLNEKRENTLTTMEYNGDDYGKTANFCSNCGTILRNIQSTAKKIECPNCGKKIKLKY
ncbi:MAG: suppressor of fused domain protein [Candidatus Hermodarchaeota archaeon]